MAKEKSKDFLKEYHKKRDFDRTAEPFGGDRRKSDGRIFVIQKHDASSLHYDFRLEIEGVLKSWAVPKGPTLDPNEKRLAVETEDHPIEYADFEGVIPEDQYGGGTVMVWDAGTYENLKKDDDGKESMSMKEAYENGELTFRLKGKKIKGGFALVKTKMRGKNNWLLIKKKDDEADARRNPVSSQPDSVMSGRSIEEIKKEESGEDED
ncbi:MAG TPA: DNA ligase [candidate division Zixibacteria bacterium]|nr:DNA ligase [candidate division Zixibacteria bacterium]HEQ98528.1 DNA ligase [candidate division Zixibacteria bacterium]